ncbi:hypothetical protein V494_08457 [Pseudogymnoascus sp. VKM F-4513 (FW-928)]|nr:hypothetical protein V494_08457 [Pseudogymnoascus sp. VKM F-4513 (FW-928)]
MKLQLFTIILAAFISITNACLSIAVSWDHEANRVTGTARDNGVVYCTLYTKKYENQLWFQCQPGYAAYITRDLKVFAWHAHGVDYRIDAYHAVNLSGHDKRWANSFGCECGGWMCQFNREDDVSDP